MRNQPTEAELDQAKRAAIYTLMEHARHGRYPKRSEIIEYASGQAGLAASEVNRKCRHLAEAIGTIIGNANNEMLQAQKLGVEQDYQDALEDRIGRSESGLS